jgi:purine-binding chemotaxis protein CheW
MSDSINSYLRFSLHNECFAMPLLLVKEVIAYPEITAIPNTPKHFLGIMNLRGQIISIIDLRDKLNIKNDFNPETTVIICDLKSCIIGIVVDSVDSVLNLKQSEIKETPEIQGPVSSEYINGIVNLDQRLILLIDVMKALDLKDKEIAAMNTGKAS